MPHDVVGSKYSGPYVEAVINGTHHVTAVVDTGSSSSLISEDTHASLSSPIDTTTAENLIAINDRDPNTGLSMCTTQRVRSEL